MMPATQILSRSTASDVCLANESQLLACPFFRASSPTLLSAALSANITLSRPFVGLLDLSALSHQARTEQTFTPAMHALQVPYRLLFRLINSNCATPSQD